MGESILFIIIVILAFIILYFQAKKNKRAHGLRMNKIADILEFNFIPNKDPNYIHEIDFFTIFTAGDDRKISNFMEGTLKDMKVRIFEYGFFVDTETIKVRSSKAVQSQNTVFIFTLPDHEIPFFTLYPEDIYHKIGQLFGYQDIDFEDHPQFSKSYLLRGDNEEAIRKLFIPRVLSYFEKNPSLHVEGQRNHILFYCMDGPIPPEDLTQTLYDFELLIQNFKPNLT